MDLSLLDAGIGIATIFFSAGVWVGGIHKDVKICKESINKLEAKVDNLRGRVS